MLTYYQNVTQKLLQDPPATNALYPTSSLTTYINIGRGQLAGEAECIRYEGIIQTVPGQRNYNFSAINVGVPAQTGVQGVINVRRIAYGVATGRKFVYNREWEFFDQFYLSNPVPRNGPPKRWAQYGQGSAGLGAITGEGSGSMSTGSFYLDPPPDLVYTLYLDCTCYPIALSADTDPEALPYLWTDAIPWWAVWYALTSSQQQARLADAKVFKDTYDDFVKRARQAANPAVNRSGYEQAFDPAQMAKLGISPQQGQR